MTEYKLTKDDFEFFKQECLVSLQAMGLDDAGFRIEYEFFPEGPSNLKAKLTYEPTQRAAWLGIRKTWEEKPTKARIKEAAQHEVIHLMLEPLGTLAQCRFASQDEINAGAHEVLNRLRRRLFG